MGSWSYKCAKSGLSIQAVDNVKDTPWQDASRVVVVYENGDKVTGDYDGFGSVRGISLEESNVKWKMVLDRSYNGETYEELGVNKNCDDQGYSRDEKLTEQWDVCWNLQMDYLLQSRRISSEFQEVVNALKNEYDFETEEYKHYEQVETEVEKIRGEYASRINEVRRTHTVKQLTYHIRR